MSRLLAQRKGRFASLTIAAPATPSQEVENKAFLAAYEITNEVLGQGTSAVVKRAIRKDTPRIQAAVKVMRTYGDEELCETVRKEFEIVKSLRHPSIVEVYDLFLAPNLSTAYLCMELVTGATLQAHVEVSGAMLESTMQPLFEQLASALCYLHCKRVTHRDLKPDNLIVDTDLQRLRICDFNCARRLADGGTLTPCVGTMAFAPPENLLGKGIMGDQGDIWAAGSCLYFALSGGATLASKLCRQCSSPQTLGMCLVNTTPAERREYIRSIGLPKDSLVAEVLWGCLNPDPAQRPDSMLLLAHPWVSPTGDTQEGLSFSSQVPPGAMATCSQRLCSRGLGSDCTQPLSSRSEGSTAASDPDTPPLEPKKAKRITFRFALASDDEDSPNFHRSLPCSPAAKECVPNVNRKEFNRMWTLA